ncbi:MAG TPA: hypothetical protein VKP30_28510, partial [Polyangiaceae bacterium]|nr:hypothetical protein [Polyangiaceae bacterium]
DATASTFDGDATASAFDGDATASTFDGDATASAFDGDATASTFDGDATASAGATRSVFEAVFDFSVGVARVLALGFRVFLLIDCSAPILAHEGRFAT